MTRKILYFFSTLSPWAYIGHAEFKRIAARHGVSVDYRPVALSRVFPETGGLPLAKRHPARQHYRMLELQRWRDKRGLAFQLRPQHWPFDPSLADKAIVALAQEGMTEPFTQRLFAAVFEQQRDLGQEATLAQILDESGLDAHWLERAKSAEIEALYQRNLAQALAGDVFGSPSYVLDGELFWGQDRLELLDDALTSGRGPYSAEA